MKEEKKEKLKDILFYLLHHNKNYTKKQYFLLEELNEIIKELLKGI